MELPKSYRLNRGVLEVTKLSEKQSDRQYWLSKTPEERFEALESECVQCVAFFDEQRSKGASGRPGADASVRPALRLGDACVHLPDRPHLLG